MVNLPNAPSGFAMSCSLQIKATTTGSHERLEKLPVLKFESEVSMKS